MGPNQSTYKSAAAPKRAYVRDDVPGRRRRLLEGRGGAGQGPAPRALRLPAGGGRAPRRARGAPPHAPRPGLRRPRDPARVPAREPDPRQFAMAYYVINYSKLRIWEFVEYERMVYLDADIEVYENIDHLFQLEKGHFYAVKDCFCEKTWSHTPQYKIGYCHQCPDKVAWPEHELAPPPPLYFNAGMI